MRNQWEIISSSINSVIIICLLLEKSSIVWNYWHAETTLSNELNSHIPQIIQAENCFREFEIKLKDFQLDEKELSLLLLMLITRKSKTINIP